MSDSLSRRDALKGLGIGSLGLAAAAAGCANGSRAGAGMTGAAAGSAVAMAGTGRYELPPLPYDSLEPVIDDRTLRLHHDKHHAGYVKGANAALEALAAARKSGDLGQVKHWSRQLAFTGSGAVLHALYWTSMWPGGRGKPSADLARAIKDGFGSHEMMLAHMKAATKAVEASGWGVLAWEPMAGRLVVLQAERHQDLTIWGAAPILVCDVWEHAYYLKYQNNRGAYVDAWAGIIDWQSANERFAMAIA